MKVENIGMLIIYKKIAKFSKDVKTFKVVLDIVECPFLNKCILGSGIYFSPQIVERFFLINAY